MAEDQRTAAPETPAETTGETVAGTTGDTAGQTTTAENATDPLEDAPRCAGPGCAKALPGRSSRAKYCSDACRAAAYRVRTTA
ncbi:hypothetical protein AB0J43_60400, partial [Nonomuraea fuscirosea]